MHKKEVAKKMSSSEKAHRKFMGGLHIGGLNPYYKGSKDYRQGMKDLAKTKGKASLNRASGKNEGDTMTLGKNENNRF